MRRERQQLGQLGRGTAVYCEGQQPAGKWYFTAFAPSPSRHPAPSSLSSHACDGCQLALTLAKLPHPSAPRRSLCPVAALPGLHAAAAPRSAFRLWRRSCRRSALQQSAGRWRAAAAPCAAVPCAAAGGTRCRLPPASWPAQGLHSSPGSDIRPAAACLPCRTPLLATPTASLWRGCRTQMT